jgi:hypothetical protein
MFGSSLALWFLVWTVRAEDLPEANPQAVAEVLAGKRVEANAAWWGFDPQEATQALQAAIRSGAKRVIVPRMPTPWIVDKIELESDQEIFFEPGVEVVAKKGAFLGRQDSLFTAWNKRNIRLIGPGATLRMHRSDYDAPPYEKAEWRHVLSLRGCTNVLVEGLTLMESGGDGIYLGAGRNREPNVDVIIRNVVCDRNYRQGISVITARRLLIEKVILRGTAGTPPAAGIDFEPNHPHELLVDCVMRDCLIEDNQGLGIHLYLGNLNADSEPVSIRIENCVTRGANARSFHLFTRNAPEEAVRGMVELVGCRFEDHGRAGILVRSKPADGLQLRVIECVIADSAEKPEVIYPVTLLSRGGDRRPLGGIFFQNLRIRDPLGRQPLGLGDPAMVCHREITGEIIVEGPEGQTVYPLEAHLLAKWMPCPPIAEIPWVPADAANIAEILKPMAGETVSVPPHRLRQSAKYAFWAREGEDVTLAVVYERVASYSGEDLLVEVSDAKGRVIARGSVPLGERREINFRGKEEGLYFITAEPRLNTFRIVESTHPLAIVAERETIHLFRTVGTFGIHVPAGRRMGLAASGEGEAERVSAELRDPEGILLWEARDIAQSAFFILEPAPADRFLQLRFSPPSQGVLEDVSVQLRGIPAHLLFWPRP